MTEPLISLARAHTELGWPKPEEIKRPSGAGAGVYAALAQDKIGRALVKYSDAQGAVIGILTADPGATTTDSPLSIVVEFNRSISDETLRELHRLAWNFSHSPALITVEPGQLRVWTCCEPPDPKRQLSDFVVHRLGPPDEFEAKSQTLERAAARALHWVNLASGEFFRERAPRFDRGGRADQMLLSNLQHIRLDLSSSGLRDDDVCHDLLARIIFVQFLFDRKDSDGNAALTPAKLERLHDERILRGLHKNFASILADYDETYRLFDWLNERFNGDLFPGKGNTPTARSQGWAREKRIVTKHHLSLLADFISGSVDLPSGQTSLWPQYSFDVIPLEFISSIYETFVTKRAAKEGIFYTPPHLVDFVFDQVLPWNGDNWDLQILDPACGSGIFLVKAFQRLIHRWKKAHPGQQIRAETLRRFLERNLLGIDKDPHAVRVACFSLYLAMCDEIDPRHYWTQVVFPDMRDRRLICSDFFTDDSAALRATIDVSVYDLVVGNAPWGENVITDAARRWAASNHWRIANKDIGTLFLAKAGTLLRPDGRVALIQSANSLLFNRSSTATAFRKQLFSCYKVEEVVNLSALRFSIFSRKKYSGKKSVAPICVVVLSGIPPSPENRIAYVSPKQLEGITNEFKIVIEPHDRRWLTSREASNDTTVWTSLMWGGSRDRTFLTRLRTYSSLSKPPSGYVVKSRKGIVLGDEVKIHPQPDGTRVFDSDSFPSDSLLYLDTSELPQVREIRTDDQDSTDFQAFAWPQIIIKKGWQQTASRFQARIVLSARRATTLCMQSYVTVHVPETQTELLEAACLSLNSMFATYYLLLTSGRFASYRPEALVMEILAVPLPPPQPGLLQGVSTQEDIDTRVFKAFGFKDAEKVLIEDIFNYTLPDFQGDQSSPGRQPTARELGQVREPQLTNYCSYFIRVLKAGFGRDKTIKATIFQESDGSTRLPYRLVAFELGGSTGEEISFMRMKLPELLNEFDALSRNWGVGSQSGSIYQQRVARVYRTLNGIPSIFVIKPDMHRYWTRSAGLSDADDVTADLFTWHQTAHSSEVA